MKYLLLLRHAKSSWKDLSLSDHDRPLNERGKRTAPLMGQRLAKKGIQPQLIISSTAIRAYSTAKLVANEINYPTPKILTDRTIFHAAPTELLTIISQCDDAISNLMLVGHNPGFTYFANQLLDTHPFDSLPTAGVVTISLAINNWQQILASSLKVKSQLLDYDYPKK